MRLSLRIALAAALATLGLSDSSAQTLVSPSTSFHPSDRQLDEVARLIDQHYLRPFARESLGVAALRCFERSLDPYSRYLNAEQAAEFEGSLAGRHGGIGVVFASDSASHGIRVVSLFTTSPALKAGIRVGDTLVAVDRRPTLGRSIDDVVGQVRGRPGTQVVLTIRHPGSASIVELRLRRVVIELLTVRGVGRADTEAGRYLADPASGTAYVRIENFSRRTPEEFDRALAAVRRIGARALVLDLRDDAGGLLESAVAIADRLLDSGDIVTLRTRSEQEVRRADRAIATRLPLAVLINGSTASAAEVLAASLQDNRRAIVVGSRSYGKGVVQELFHLKLTPGLLKLTTTEYRRPSGLPMERRFRGIGSERGGVWPDSGLAVVLTEEEEQRWGVSAYLITNLMQTIGTGDGAAAPVPDRVLDRAIRALAERGISPN